MRWGFREYRSAPTPLLEESQQGAASTSSGEHGKAWASREVYQRDFLSLGLRQEKCLV